MFDEHEINDVQMPQIGNMDEVANSFDMPRNYTISEKRVKYVRILTNGMEKRNFTVVSCDTADGAKCNPIVIFKRTTIPKGNFPKTALSKLILPVA